MNIHSHPALAGFDVHHTPHSTHHASHSFDMPNDVPRRPAPNVMSAGDLAELSREEHRAKFKHSKSVVVASAFLIPRSQAVFLLPKGPVHPHLRCMRVSPYRRSIRHRSSWRHSLQVSFHATI